MKTPDEIIPDTEIESVHANSNFGEGISKRDVVDKSWLTPWQINGQR